MLTSASRRRAHSSSAPISRPRRCANEAAPRVSWRRSLPRIAALPGVRAAGATTGVPLEVGAAEQAITRYGDPVLPAAQSPHVAHMAVTPGYFSALGIALNRGRIAVRRRSRRRSLSSRSSTKRQRGATGPATIRSASASRLAAVSGSDFFARRPQPSAIEWREIVGVVADFRSAGFASEIQPEVFYNYKQFPLYDPSIVVRTTGDPDAMFQSIRAAIAATNSRRLVTKMRTLDDVADQSIADPRIRAAARLAVLRAGSHARHARHLRPHVVHGVQQTRELGIRMALGADRRQLAFLMMGKALRLSARRRRRRPRYGLRRRAVALVAVFRRDPERR